MNIDELQARFNELRAKKWRTVNGHKPVEFIGFLIGYISPTIFIQVERDIILLEPFHLYLIYGCGEPYTFIEEDTPSYADWPIDAKVWVWDDGKTKSKRYFAGIHEDGRPMAWVGGSTSWSDPTTFVWDYAELAED